MTAAVLLTVAAAALPARAQSPAGDLHLLDVPYLPQSELLCGGAAAAMVMRYWGATGVYAESFAPLVDESAGGIRGADLLRDLQSRGWEAHSFRGDAALVQQQLAARHPIVALIEDRPGRFHYVVIVAWASNRIVLHDPARAPFRVMDEARFLRAWEPSGFWTMLMMPGAAGVTPGRTETKAAPAGGNAGPCQEMVDEGIKLATSGDVQEARSLFEIAASNCPAAAAPWREMAGLHALGSRWREAAADARRALARDARDEQAARILATALYLEGDSGGALAAWNRFGEPRIDIININGLDRTRYSVAATALGLRTGDVLLRSDLARAARRLEELPSGQVARVSYRPVAAGRADIDAVVLERPLLPASLPAIAATGVRAITDRELMLTIASPSGGGEAWQASWRWWERRPRVALRFDAPAPFGGTWGIEIAHEVQTYAVSSAWQEEVHRTATFHVSDWTPTALRWQLSAGVNAWRGAGRGAELGLALEQRLFDDRVTLNGAGTARTIASGAWSASAGGEWRSSITRNGQVLIARGGAAFAGDRAPLSAWPGAGTGQGRDVLLRAHPLLDAGVIDGAAFGRRLAHAGVEWRSWYAAGRGLLRVAPAIFLDSARAWRGVSGTTGRTEADAGAGLRIAVPGSGLLRIDLARGLRSGGFVFSAGWTK